jgi:UDP-hydrolysing UDP-N-acetyl-D-glucosamine 2-epimerase
MENKRKILVPIFNRAHLGRLKPVLLAIKENPFLELQIMVGLPAAYGNFWLNLKHSRPTSWKKSLPWYLRARLSYFFKSKRPSILGDNNFLVRALAGDGFKIDSFLPLFFDGGLSEIMAKSVGLGLIRITDELKRLKPDIVFVNADRFEMMAVALAASYMNILVTHNEAGDISGTIDEGIRHAITKLSHIHFTASDKSRQRVLQMGENPEFIFNVGSPAIDAVKSIDLSGKLKTLPEFNLNKKFLLVLLHSVATESREYNYSAIKNLVAVLEELKMPTIFLGSNIDAGSAEIGKAILKLRRERPEFMTLVKNLPADDFYLALAKASCVIGNSSSFIREGAFLGTPAVLIGSRQQGRDRSENAIESEIESEEIKKKILFQLEHGRYQKSLMFGDGKSGESIAKILAEAHPPIQKKFFEIK